MFEVAGPLGTPVMAGLGWLADGSCIIELAQASGLTLVPHGLKDPMSATSRGTGELIAGALSAGCRDLYIAIGGSATHDCGMGLLRALGMEFLNAEGEPAPEGGLGLGHVRGADFSKLRADLKEARITVICDVTNPLTGPNGAVSIYGEQKGADAHMREALERGTLNFAAAMKNCFGRDIGDFPGAGAAGGVGAALGGILRARIAPGIDAVLNIIRFNEILKGADLCVTAEGRLDSQSIAYGKAAAGVAKRCAALNIPVAMIAGSMAGDIGALYDLTEASVITAVNAPMALDEAMGSAAALFEGAAERMFRFIKMGMRLRAINL
jgi:glycerate kinase